MALDNKGFTIGAAVMHLNLKVGSQLVPGYIYSIPRLQLYVSVSCRCAHEKGSATSKSHQHRKPINFVPCWRAETPNHNMFRLSKLRDTWRPSLQSSTSADRAPSARQQVLFQKNAKKLNSHPEQPHINVKIEPRALSQGSLSCPQQLPFRCKLQHTKHHRHHHHRMWFAKLLLRPSFSTETLRRKAHTELVKFPQEARRITV